jgi:hypothetical protein
MYADKVDENELECRSKKYLRISALICGWSLYYSRPLGVDCSPRRLLLPTPLPPELLLRGVLLLAQAVHPVV